MSVVTIEDWSLPIHKELLGANLCLAPVLVLRIHTRKADREQHRPTWGLQSLLSWKSSFLPSTNAYQGLLEPGTAQCQGRQPGLAVQGDERNNEARQFQAEISTKKNESRWQEGQHLVSPGDGAWAEI